VTEVLVAMGADGDDGHAQRFDGEPIHLEVGDCSALDLGQLPRPARSWSGGAASPTGCVAALTPNAGYALPRC
jgi:hypothetical protein